MAISIRFKLNGSPIEVKTDPDRMLLWVLRGDAGLTGTKHSCGEGFCGACTVLVNDDPVLSCQFPVSNVEGKDVVTIEGLLQDGEHLHPVQAAFLEHNALQCGYCTPGMVLASVALLKKNPDPSPQDIADALEGNLCRCGTYNRIILAVQTAARSMQGGRV